MARTMQALVWTAPYESPQETAYLTYRRTPGPRAS